MCDHLSQAELKFENLSDLKDGSIGTVKIGGKREPVNVLSNAILTMPEITSKLNTSQSYLLEQAEHHNLPNGLVVNSCYITPKVKRVSVILIKATDHYIWIRQPLLAVEIFEVEVEPEQCHTVVEQEG